MIIISILSKRIVLYLKKSKFHLPKEASCQFWSKFSQWFWKRLLNIFMYNYLTITLLSPLWQGHGPFIITNFNPIAIDDENVTSFYRMMSTDGWTDNSQQETRKAHVKLSTKVSSDGLIFICCIVLNPL